MFDVLQTEAASRPPAQAPLLPEAEQQILQDLMSDAMEETDSLQSHLLQQNGQTLILFVPFAKFSSIHRTFNIQIFVVFLPFFFE